MADVPKRPPRPLRPQSSEVAGKGMEVSDCSTVGASVLDPTAMVDSSSDKAENIMEKEGHNVTVLPDHSCDTLEVEETPIPTANDDAIQDQEIESHCLQLHAETDKHQTTVARVEMRLRKSPKTRRAPPVPFSLPKEVQSDRSLSTEQCEVTAKNDECSAVVQLATNVSESIFPIGNVSPSHNLERSVSQPDSHHVSNVKPAVKPKPSPKILRESSPKTDVDTMAAMCCSNPESAEQSLTLNSQVNVKSLPTSNEPIYAVVDKSKKSRKRQEGAADNVDSNNATNQKDSADNDGNESHPKLQLATAANCPPKKPPRTFAHPGPMAATEKSATLPASIQHFSLNLDYEEIGNKANESASFNGGNSTIKPEDDNSSNVISQEAAVRRRQTSDKLPAPPRPPPPAVNDQTKRSSVPTVKQVDSSDVSASKSTAKNFVRNSLFFRNSERSSKAAGKTPARSKSMLESRSSDQPKLAQKSSRVSADDDDDGIYAVPSEIAAADGDLKIENSTCSVNSQDDCSSPHQKTRAKIREAYSILRLNVVAANENDIIVEACEDNDELSDDIHKQHMQHVSTVREKTQSQVMRGFQTKEKQKEHLFEFALVVGLKFSDEDNVYKPVATYQHPRQDSQTIDSVLHFCFPDCALWRPVTVYEGEVFTFVLTDSDGTKRFGYCHRYLPPGRGNRLPEALCIVSFLCEISLYSQVLSAAEDRLRATSADAMHELLQAAYSQPCPQANCEVQLSAVSTLNDPKKCLTLRRAGEGRPDNVSFDELLSHLNEAVLMQVFASLLLERRIIFCAQKLSTLTRSIHSLLTILYPFEWQHVFVPVLPASMIDVLETPVPYVFGILSSTYARLLCKSFCFSEVLVIDLDGGKLLHRYGDEDKILPSKLQKALVASLKDDNDSLGLRDIAVTEAFLRFFIETCGHYTDFICTQQDGLGVFQREYFIKAVSSNHIQRFLEWFTITQMFEVFMTSELQGCKHVSFETRVLEYREEMSAERQSHLKQVKVVGRKIKDFFVETGGKLRKKWQNRNVFV